MAKAAKLVQLDLEQLKGEWIFTVSLDGMRAAVMRAMPEQDSVLVHLTVHAWSRELCREYICCFMAVRELLQEAGYRLLVACSDHCDKKMKHFWHMMGFRVFGEFERQGHTYAYAVMEA